MPHLALSSRFSQATATFKKVTSVLIGSNGSAPPRKPDLPSHLKHGVSLAFLRAFARILRVADGDSTHVAGVKVLEYTRKSQRSVAEMHEGDMCLGGIRAVGEATIFFSHAHACSFHQLLDAIECHLAEYGLDPATTFFWLDLVCMRQHFIHEEVMHIYKVERHIGTVVVILEPWDAPRTWASTWCVYEMLHAMRPTGRLIMSLSSSERKRMRQAIEADEVAVRDLAAAFDVRCITTASGPEHEALLDIVRRLCTNGADREDKLQARDGAERFNAQVHAALLDLVDRVSADGHRR